MEPTRPSTTSDAISGPDVAAEADLAARIAAIIDETYADMSTSTEEQAHKLTTTLQATDVNVRRLHLVLDDVLDRLDTLGTAKHSRKTVKALRPIVDGWLVLENKRDRAKELIDEFFKLQDTYLQTTVGEMSDRDWTNIARAISMIDEAAQIGVDLSIPLPEELVVAGVSLRAVYDDHTRIRNEQARRDKIAARQAARPELTPMAGRKCSMCHKKPARVDDLCKVCARQSGIIIHGKVGGS